MERKDFISELLKAVPEFIGRYKSNVKYDNEELRHLILGDMTRFVINRYRISPNDPVFRRAISFLESAMSSNDVDIQDLIWCSFLENLHLAGSDYGGIKSQLGPSLLSALEKIEKQDAG